MKRYLIIAIALIVGILVALLLARLSANRKPDDPLVSYRLIISAAASLITLVALSLMLEIGTGTPDLDYQPPRVENGELIPGQFVESGKNAE